MATAATLPGARRAQSGQQLYALTALILAQSLAWLVASRYLQSEEDWLDFALVPNAPTELGTLLSPFLHVHPSHLAINLVALWLFGRRLEGALGSLAFLALYLGAAWFAALMNLAVAGVFGLAVIGDRQSAALGSSGAVAGVLGLYFVRYPHARFRVPLGHRPAIWAWPILAAWLLYELSLALAETVAHGVDGLGHWTHFAGFIFGVAAGVALDLQREARREELLHDADAAIAAGDYRAAARCWRWLLHLTPNRSDVRRQALAALVAAGRMEEARRLAAEALTRLATGREGELAVTAYLDAVALLGEVTLPAGVRFRLAAKLAETGHPDAAVRAYLLAANEEARSEGGAAALFRAGLLAAEALEDAGLCRQAWGRIAAEHPDSPWREEVARRMPPVRGRSE